MIMSRLDMVRTERHHEKLKDHLVVADLLTC